MAADHGPRSRFTMLGGSVEHLTPMNTAMKLQAAILPMSISPVGCAVLAPETLASSSAAIGSAPAMRGDLGTLTYPCHRFDPDRGAGCYQRNTSRRGIDFRCPEHGGQFAARVFH